MEAQGLDLGVSLALELNSQAAALEQGSLKNTIYDCLQEKEGIQI